MLSAVAYERREGASNWSTICCKITHSAKLKRMGLRQVFRSGWAINNFCFLCYFDSRKLYLLIVTRYYVSLSIVSYKLFGLFSMCPITHVHTHTRVRTVEKSTIPH